MSDLAKQDCACKIAKHEHGTRTAYVVDKCRCEDCREAATSYERNRRRQTAYGRFDTGRVDATPAREHVRYLMDNGISYKQVAKLSGVSLSAVGALLYGRHERGHAPYPRITKAVADKILAVQPSLATMAGGRNIDSTGTKRRIQALVAIGWSLSRIGQRIGMSATNMSTFMQNDQCSVTKAKAVRKVYDQLWDQPQTGTDQRSRISANRARNYAKAHGWAPPLAWDDDAIDDPAAVPDMGERTLLRDSIAEDVEYLHRTGTDREEIAARLGTSWTAIEKQLYRSGRNDLVTTIKTDTRANVRQARKGQAA